MKNPDNQRIIRIICDSKIGIIHTTVRGAFCTPHNSNYTAYTRLYVTNMDYILIICANTEYTDFQNCEKIETN